MINEKLFPQGFLWGAATSSHQVEGNNKLNDWWDWETQGLTADPSGVACDSYHRYKEDFSLASQMNHTAHRFSIEWSRVEPQEGVWNLIEIEHYKKLVKDLKNKGLQPLVTLHHFTNPKWFSEDGGWQNPESVKRFLRYAIKIVRAIGCDVRYWVTINEQNVLTFKGRIEGDWPPGGKSLMAALSATRHMATAHAAVYRMIHKTYPLFGWKRPMVGLAQHFMIAEPSRKKSFFDRLNASLREYFNNDFFLKLITGRSHTLLRAILATGYWKSSVDFIGVNYYFREFIHSNLSSFDWRMVVGEMTRQNAADQQLESNSLGWEVYPEGFEKVVRHLWKTYGFPLIITENGICTDDDSQRERFLIRHLTHLHRCIQDQIPVLGYFYWSLLDNFEWSIGYEPKFGLIAVEPDTLRRILKPSAQVYAEICRTSKIPEK